MAISFSQSTLPLTCLATDEQKIHRKIIQNDERCDRVKGKRLEYMVLHEITVFSLLDGEEMRQVFLLEGSRH